MSWLPLPKALCLVGVVVAALGGASASAQETRKQELDSYTPTGTRIERDPTKLEGKELHSLFDEMATCVVRQSPDRADFFLRMSDDFRISDEIDDITKFLPLPKCVGNARPNSLQTMARFSTKFLRNWLSEKTYLAANPTFMAVAANSGPVPARTYFSREALVRAQAFGAFADCMIAADAQRADALLRTERGTPAERSAAGALAPAMGACIPEGTTFTLDADTVRGLAAQGLWQRYEAPKPSRYKAGS